MWYQEYKDIGASYDQSEDWRHFAECAKPGVDPEWFHAPDGRKQPDARAFKICQICPVFKECDEWRKVEPLVDSVQAGVLTRAEDVTWYFMKNCLSCDDEFLPRNASQKYCVSPACKQERMRRNWSEINKRKTAARQGKLYGMLEEN